MDQLKQIKARNISHGVFGDIDVIAHREWAEKVCGTQTICALLPLWKRSRIDLLNEWMDLGFRAELIAIKNGVLSPALLGKTLDANMLRVFEENHIDLSGENGTLRDPGTFHGRTLITYVVGRVALLVVEKVEFLQLI